MGALGYDPVKGLVGQTVTPQDAGPVSSGPAEVQGNRHGGAATAVAFTEGNWEPSTPGAA